MQCYVSTTSRLTHEIDPPLRTKQGAGCAHELVWALWRREKSLAAAVVNPQQLNYASHYKN